MREFDDPPDNWDEPDPAVTDPVVRLRAAWIAAAADFRARNTGNRATYRPGVRLDGGQCPQTRHRYKPVWPPLAAGASERGLDPVDLVETLFRSKLGGFLPHPREILADDNVRRCRADAARADRLVASALTTEEAVFRSARWAAGLDTPDPQAAVRFVLNDAGRTISPLFRYCAAVLYQMPEESNKWRAAAVAQYRRRPQSYAKHWRRVLPPDLLVETATSA